MYKLFNNRTIIYGAIDLLIQLSLRENARNGLFCSQLSRENGKEARATVVQSKHKLLKYKLNYCERNCNYINCKYTAKRYLSINCRPLS